MAPRRADRGHDDEIPEEYGFDDDLVFDFEDDIDFGDVEQTSTGLTRSSGGDGPAEPPGGTPPEGSRNGENRWAVLALLAVVVLVGLVLSFAFPVPETRTGSGGGDVQQVWLCPDTPGGGKAGTSTVSIANLSDSDMTGSVDFVPGDGEAAPEAATISVPAKSRSVVNMAEKFKGRSGGVIVSLPPGAAAVAEQVNRTAEEPKGAAAFPCATSSSVQWLFASGSTKQGRDQALILMNPSQDSAIVDLSFVTEAGEERPGKGSGVTLAPGSVQVLDVDKDLVLRRENVSTIVRTQRGRVVAAQRLSVAGAAGFGESLGTPDAGGTWYLTGGKNGGGQSQSLSILNATGDPSTYTVTLDPDQNQEPVPPLLDQQIDPGGRANIDLADVLAQNQAAGFEVDSTTATAVDQVRSFETGRELVAAVGETASRWALPASGEDARQDVLEVQNPSGDQVDVEVFMVGSQGGDLTKLGETFTLPGASRASITLGDLKAPQGSYGLLVTATAGIVAARGYAAAGDRVLAVGSPVP